MPQTKSTKKKPIKKKDIKLTKKQKIFADEYIDNGMNGVQAAKKAYNTDDYNTLAVIATENINKPNIKAYLDSFGDLAGSVIESIMLNGEKETTRLDAAKYTYDHVHGKAIQKVVHAGDKDNPITIESINDDTTFKQLEEMKKQLINLSKNK